MGLTAGQREKGFAKESACNCCTGDECQKCSYDYILSDGEECPAGTEVKTNIGGQIPMWNCRKYAPYDPAQGAECPEIGGGWAASIATSICCNEVCCQAGEKCCEGKCCAKPGAPTNFIGEGGDGQVSLSWDAPVSDGSNAPATYHISWNSPWAVPRGGDGQTTGTNYLVPGLTNGISYAFTLRAANIAGFGPFASPEVTVTPARVPDAPTNVSGVRGNGQVVVSWYDGSSGGSDITDHTIEGGPTLVHTGSGYPGSHTVTGLTNGTSYTFKVKAWNRVGPSPYSAPSAPVTPATRPGAPTNFNSSPCNNGQVTLTWSPPEDDGGDPVSGYHISRSPGGGPGDSNGDTPNTSLVMTGLTPSLTYTFGVQARNSAGESVYPGATVTVTCATPSEDCCVTCTTEGNYSPEPIGCPDGFTSESHLGAYRCIRRVRTSIGCMDDPAAANSACYASGGSPTNQSSPCP